MQNFEGRLVELRLGLYPHQPMAWIACPPGAVPSPGRYVVAWSDRDADAPLATPLFATQVGETGFLAAAHIPANWTPGEALHLRGPLGRGFGLPAPARRLALAGLGDGLARLLPLVWQALARQAAVALFCDTAPMLLPPAVEVSPLGSLAEALAWADYLALELPLERLPELRALLDLSNGATGLAFSAEVLVSAPMPCAGIGECGACALPGRSGRGWKLACKHGPVFDLNELLRSA